MQFGNCLQRLLQRLAYYNPVFGAPLLAKVDLSDGYYRIPLSPDASLTLAVILPSDGLNEPLLGLPLSLPMGWKSSPLYFCAFTETCADLANFNLNTTPAHTQPFLHANVPQPALTSNPTFHPLARFPYNPKPPSTPLKHVDIYMDDFMVVAQWQTANSALTTLLHSIGEVFQDSHNSLRGLVISVSKIAKGDTTLSTTQRLLGWDIKPSTMTLHLPPHRVTRLAELLSNVQNKKFVLRRRWQTLLGELRSMVLALHSSKHMFSVLQHLLLNTNKRRLYISRHIRQTLHQWQQMVHRLHHQPVPIAALVPHAPHYYSVVDASAQGMGGFWLPTTLTDDSQPYVWRIPFPKTLIAELVSPANPSGTLTNSNLELAAAVMGHTLLLHTASTLPFTSVQMATDNTPTQAWIQHGSTSTTKAPAFLLSQLANTNQTHNASVSMLFTPGATNTIADFLSRSFALSDADMLCQLNSMAPVQPQWKLATPPEHLVYTMNSALSRKLLPGESPCRESKAITTLGPSGPPSVWTSPVTRSSSPSKTPSPYYKYSLSDTAWKRWLPPPLRSSLG
jgi:hypothetical protein